MTKQQQRATLDWLEEEIRTDVRYANDDAVVADAFDWLKRKASLPGGDMMALVEEKLGEVRHDENADGFQEYAMRRVDGDGRANFPDSCQGCEHYGTRCPVFVDPVEQKRRERIQSDYSDASPAKTRQVWRQYAESNACHQIADVLQERARNYEELVNDGYDIYQRLAVASGAAGDEAAARAAAEEALGGAEAGAGGD